MILPNKVPPVTARRLALLSGVLCLALAAFLIGPWRAVSRPQLSLGLFGTLPILWHEGDGLDEYIKPQEEPHWAAVALRRSGNLTPLDILDPVPAGLDVLIMAQPRPLSPQENVALDTWVRGGGRVLMFVDPMLTQKSRFALGDPRRPHDIAMLSPILTHWGLELQSEDSQPAGERRITLLRRDVPVNLSGRFVRTTESGTCGVLARGLAAECRIGRGRILALADAALLEPADAAESAERADVLEGLLARLNLAP